MSKLHINTKSIRKTASNIREGQGTRIGSMAKMLIDCCDKIDTLEAENTKLRNLLQKLYDAEGAERTQENEEPWMKVMLEVEQALKEITE